MHCCPICELAAETIFNLVLINGSCKTAEEYRNRLDVLIDKLKSHNQLCGQCNFIEDLKL